MITINKIQSQEKLLTDHVRKLNMARIKLAMFITADEIFAIFPKEDSLNFFQLLLAEIDEDFDMRDL